MYWHVIHYKDEGNSGISQNKKQTWSELVLLKAWEVSESPIYLLSFLTLYHVSPRSAFIASISPLGMVILNSFPKASFSSASLSSLPMACNSSFNWVPTAPPLTAILVSANDFDLCLAVFFVTSSVVFLALVLLINSRG